MKKILIIGNAPLPNENTKSRPAAGLRTYQFAKPLQKSRHDVRFVTIAMPECYDKEPGDAPDGGDAPGDVPDGGDLCFSKNDPRLISKIQKIHDEFQPDAIVAINTYPSYVAAQLASTVPMWADLNGWIMAEGQAQAYKMDSNDYLGHYFEMERAVLRRADKFSTVSGAQKHAVIGELAGMGRLNKESFGYEFVHHIPNGTEWFDGEETGFREQPEIFKDVPSDGVIALWMGGYNTWVDEETLFKGVSAAMSACEKLYFVSTGGKIEGLDNDTFKRFRELIDDSEYRDRFVFLGWVETADIPYIYKRADFGLNVDRMCVETETGARNRINEMMKFGLPVVTTLGSEIASEVSKCAAGICVRSGDAEDLSSAICSIYKEGAGSYGENGQNFIKNECNYGKLIKSLEKWFGDLRAAPDRNVKLRFSALGKAKGGLKYLREKGVRKTFKKVFQKLR